MREYPVRQESAQGQPAEPSPFMRTCRGCSASFRLLAAGKTGLRGLWDACGSWYCSQQCFDGRTVVERAASVLVQHQRRDAGSCICDWGEGGSKLGLSHAVHQAEKLHEAGALSDDSARIDVAIKILGPSRDIELPAQVSGHPIREALAVLETRCGLYWGSHGCALLKGHDEKVHQCGSTFPPCSQFEVTGDDVWLVDAQGEDEQGRVYTRWHERTPGKVRYHYFGGGPDAWSEWADSHAFRDEHMVAITYEDEGEGG